MINTLPFPRDSIRKRKFLKNFLKGKPKKIAVIAIVSNLSG